MIRHIAFGAAMAVALPLAAQEIDVPARVLPPPPSELGPITMQYVSVDAPVVVLRNARVIDGTGTPAAAGRTIVMEDGVIVAYGGAELETPEGALELDMTGKTVLPGLVGMHDHLFYIARPKLKVDGSSEWIGVLAPQMSYSAPRMYLANGVTTLRTAGSVEPFADLNLKADIDAGLYPGPHIDATAPYLEGPPGVTIQQHRLTGPEDAAKMVHFWADMGASSIKVYERIRRDELAAAIEAAHSRGLKVTGHLCAVTYPQAIEIGIDNIEHGFFANTQLAQDRQDDVCMAGASDVTMYFMAADNPARAELIAALVEKGVAVTSTLGVFEGYSSALAPLTDAAMDTMTLEARRDYFVNFLRFKSIAPEVLDQRNVMWANATSMEKEFVEAGGLLLAGSDSTGFGQMLPGFGNHRAIELLVLAAGFTPEEAIEIATRNGAVFLGLEDRIGSIAEGMNADLFIVNGDPSSEIADIRNVEIVFKDGIGYDTGALLESVRGVYGRY